MGRASNRKWNNRAFRFKYWMEPINQINNVESIMKYMKLFGNKIKFLRLIK